jgi:sulfate adenylyltransferase
VLYSTLLYSNLALNLFYFVRIYSVPLGEDFYGAYDAQNFAIENSKALGVTPVPSLNLVYTQEEVRPFSFVFLTYFRYLKIFFKILIVLNRIFFFSQHLPSYFHTYITPHTTQDFVTADYAKEKGLTMKNLSGTKFRQMLRAGDDIPTW